MSKRSKKGQTVKENFYQDLLEDRLEKEKILVVFENRDKASFEFDELNRNVLSKIGENGVNLIVNDRMLYAHVKGNIYISYCCKNSVETEKAMVRYTRELSFD